MLEKGGQLVSWLTPAHFGMKSADGLGNIVWFGLTTRVMKGSLGKGRSLWPLGMWLDHSVLQVDLLNLNNFLLDCNISVLDQMLRYVSGLATPEFSKWFSKSIPFLGLIWVQKLPWLLWWQLVERNGTSLLIFLCLSVAFDAVNLLAFFTAWLGRGAMEYGYSLKAGFRRGYPGLWHRQVKSLYVPQQIKTVDDGKNFFWWQQKLGNLLACVAVSFSI